MSRIKQKRVAIAIGALIAAAAAAAVYQAQVATDADDGSSVAGIQSTAIKGQGDTVGAINQGAGGTQGAAGSAASDTERGTYVVVFKEAALASYKGTVPGIGVPERYRDESGTLRLDT